MKKEQIRYYLVEYCGILKYEYNTLEDLKLAFDRIRRYNDREKEPFIIGNMTYKVEDGMYVLYAHMYNKLKEKSTISELDDYTSQYTEKELIKELYDKFRLADPDKTTNKKCYYPDINIAYFADNSIKKNSDIIKRIKYIPVLYKDDRKYLNLEDPKYIEKCLEYYAINGNFEFFEELSKEYIYNKSVSDKLIELNDTIRHVKSGEYGSMMLFYVSYELFALLKYETKNGIVLKDEHGKCQISRRRLRDFGFFIKNFKSKNNKIPTRYSYTNDETKLRELESIREELLKLKSLEQSELKLKK